MTNLGPENSLYKMISTELCTTVNFIFLLDTTSQLKLGIHVISFICTMIRIISNNKVDWFVQPNLLPCMMTVLSCLISVIVFSFCGMVTRI